jgi:hypothetical protein
LSLLRAKRCHRIALPHFSLVVVMTVLLDRFPHSSHVPIVERDVVIVNGWIFASKILPIAAAALTPSKVRLR